jgi:hypothetical protein
VQTTCLGASTLRATPRDGTRGRPGPGVPPEQMVDQSAGALASSRAARQALIDQHSGFILATNARDATPRPPPQLLEGDTGQTPAERGCRFLKDPALLASALDRKTPERIMALVMVMTVCWLGYAALEYRIRQHCRGMTRRFPIHKGNVCSIQPPGGCVMILWAFISSWLQDHGPSCCISPMRIATSCHSWGNRLGHCMASTIHENQNGHAECRLRS